MGKEHTWNFRMAYAYYYLDQEGPALTYFERALNARPGDEDTLALIEDCRRRLALHVSYTHLDVYKRQGKNIFFSGFSFAGLQFADAL